MADVPIVIAFGPNESSYYIGVGRRFAMQNMPPSLVEKIQGGSLPVNSIDFISLDKSGTQWVAKNFITRESFWSVRQGSELQKQLGTAPCELVTFPDSPDVSHYFMKTTTRGLWNLDLADPTIEVIQGLRKDVAGFDLGLKWIIWGHQGTAIYQFESGERIEWVEGAHENQAHPLQQLLKEFPSWTFEKGSSLCLYNPDYYFLKLRSPRDKHIEFRAKLPPEMNQKLNELMAIARTDTEQQALLMDEDRILSNLRNNAAAELRLEANRNRMAAGLNNTMIRGGIGFASAAGLAYEEVDQYGNRRRI